VNQAALIDSLIKHEGLKLKPYKCTANKTTIGVGRNLDDNGITEAEAMLLVKNDIDTCVTELDRTRPNWRQHNEIRQNVLVEMVFNLGMPRLNKFTKMWAALEAKDYNEAAKQMRDSVWARQVKGRAVTLAEKMRLGA
jgi:lysozyme